VSSRDRSPAGRRRTYFHLQTAAQRLRVTADRLFTDEAGITTAQAAVLMLVVNHAGCSQSLIAGRLGQRESAVTTMVGRLEKAGLVERRASRDDGRAWELWPTDAGGDALGRLDVALSTVNKYLDQAIGADADAFVDALQRLVDLLDSGV
jgi:MarR family transcriptional regulator, organic hydroperoxide resistance regulator